MSNSYNIENLRDNDNDKYLALLFAPADKKDQLAALFTFHYEISQVPLEVSENMVGMIKLQWWRDCFEEIRQGKPARPHPVLKDLVHSNINLDRLEDVINQYEKLLENWQPRNFTELEEFIDNTQVIVFEQAANVLETTYSTPHVKAYCYTYFARKLARNAKTSQKFATEPEVLVNKLVTASKELLKSNTTIFDVITSHYNEKLAKNSQKLEAGRWKLLLKLAFCRFKLL